MIAIYAFDHELARAPRASSNPLIGEMRLAFWHEALDEIFEGRTVRAHPVAQGLAAAVRRRGLPRAPLQAMLESRDRELEPSSLTLDEARILAAATGGQAARLAARVLAPGDPDAASIQGARWALARLLSAGRISESDRPKTRAELLGQGRAPPIAVTAFPAAAHAALVRPYAAGRRPSGLEKRLRITWAVARGRV